MQALEVAAEWIEHNCTGSERILICTDSLSACMALESHNPETDGIRDLLRNHKETITIQWIPGHADVPGNDMADSVAKGASMMLDQPRPISFRSACMVVKSTFQDTISHARIADTYSKYKQETEKEIKTRTDQVQLARIRSGKHLGFAAYRHMLDQSVPAECPRCSEEEQTVDHWLLRCPATLGARQEIFGEEMTAGMHLLTSQPTKSLALARRSLLGVGRQ